MAQSLKSFSEKVFTKNFFGEKIHLNALQWLCSSKPLKLCSFKLSQNQISWSPIYTKVQTDFWTNLIYQIHNRFAHALQTVVFLDSLRHPFESGLDIFAKTKFDRLLQILLRTGEWIQLPSTALLLDSLCIVMLIAK